MKQGTELLTGTVEEWWVQPLSQSHYIIWGSIYGDIHGRFTDGTVIHTSRITYAEVEDPKEGDTIHTENSVYYLGKQKGKK